MGGDTKGGPATRGFDYAAFKEAFESQDIETWLSFFDENAEWVEYRYVRRFEMTHITRRHRQAMLQGRCRDQEISAAMS